MAKGSRGGRRGGGGGLNPSDIKSTKSLISERETQQQLVDDTLAVFNDVYDEYGVQIDDIQLATLDPKANALAYYDGSNIAINEKYFDNDIMELAYQKCFDNGFHPSKGNKTALQAVVAHELGHKLTDAVGAKMGVSGIDNSALAIVNEARKSTKHKGVVQMASKISGYATYSNAEAIAEAFADVFCNGNKAHSESRAIVDVLNKYLKGSK